MRKNKKPFVIEIPADEIKIRRGKKLPTKIHKSKNDKSKRGRNDNFDE